MIVQDLVVQRPQSDARWASPRVGARVAAAGLILLTAVGLTGAQQAAARDTVRARAAVANGVPVDPGTYRFAVKLTMTDIPAPRRQPLRQRLLRGTDRTTVDRDRWPLLSRRQPHPS